MKDDFYANMLELVQGLTSEIKELKTALALSKPVYTNAELMDLLGVSTKTVKKWRDAGLLGYSQVGEVYLYSKADVEAFLLGIHHNAYAHRTFR